MKSARCPTCQTMFDPAKSSAMPFCSDRCRLIDLRRWLNEEHGIPVDEYDEEDSVRERPRSRDGDHTEN